MGDWSSYSLSDFLLFSPQVYERLFVLNNQDMWPAQFIWLALGAGALASAMRLGRSAAGAGAGALVVIMGAAWLSVAAGFFSGRYQEINWLGAYMAPLAALQGAGLIAFGLWGRVGFAAFGGARMPEIIGLGVLAFAIAGFPLMAPAFGFSAAGAQVFGLTPDPTALASLAALALIARRMRFVLAVLPIGWCVFTGLTLWTLGRADYLIAPGLMAIALIAIAWPRGATQSDQQMTG